LSISNTLFVGKVLLEFQELPSTNLFALELLSKSRPAEGTAISAANQTEGRGQIGSKWLAEPGKNIALSIIFYPFFLKAVQQFSLSQAVALALHDWASALLSQPVYLKWPNDLYIGDRKAGGVLIQNAISGSTLQSSVVGIGVNVNQTVFDENLPNPTSLKLAGKGSDFDLQSLQQQLFQQLEYRYLQLKNGHAEAIATAYHERLYGLGLLKHFERADGSTFRGSICGTTDSGRLRIIDELGAEHTFDLKGVRMLHDL